MFYRVLNMSLFAFFIIVVIKLNPIWGNTNPKLQNIFRKSKGASKRKLLCIAAKNPTLGLSKFLDLLLLNYIARTSH